jgi:hypothetical protein
LNQDCNVPIVGVQKLAPCITAAFTDNKLAALALLVPELGIKHPARHAFVQRLISERVPFGAHQFFAVYLS